MIGPGASAQEAGSMLYRFALQGFSESDRRTLASFLCNAGSNERIYKHVDQVANAHILLADGDKQEVVANVVNEARIATTLFLSENRPPEAAWHVARPTSPSVLLRGLAELLARLDLAPEAAAPSGTDNAHAHAQAKAAARRAARHARLVATGSIDRSSITADVLVLDRNDQARDHLCTLLEHFGFCTYPARSNSQALWLIEARPFRAAFLDIAFDGSNQSADIEVCRRIKTSSDLANQPMPVLFIVSGDTQPSDRVRAALLGSDAFLVKPLGRGDVARALEACGVTMPSDDRRS